MNCIAKKHQFKSDLRIRLHSKNLGLGICPVYNVNTYQKKIFLLGITLILFGWKVQRSKGNVDTLASKSILILSLRKIYRRFAVWSERQDLSEFHPHRLCPRKILWCLTKIRWRLFLRRRRHWSLIQKLTRPFDWDFRDEMSSTRDFDIHRRYDVWNENWGWPEIRHCLRELLKKVKEM